MTPEEHLTPEKMDEIREEATRGLGLDNGYATTVILDAFEIIDDLRRRNKKLERFFKAFDEVESDESYGRGGMRCHDDCNSNHAWGKDAPCDCNVGDVHKAYQLLKGTILDDLVADD